MLFCIIFFGLNRFERIGFVKTCPLLHNILHFKNTSELLEVRGSDQKDLELSKYTAFINSLIEVCVNSLY